jgi:SAM-dependent methyltransferase
VQAESKIIDVGAGECQYLNFFRHAHYVSQDLCVGDQAWDYSRIDIQSEIDSIPVASNSFDFVLCTEVLEHVAFPEKAFREFQRILKPQGKLFLTVPFVFGEHQIPHDYFRYTRFGLFHLAKEHGFVVQEIKPQGGRFQCLSNFLIELLPGFFAERGIPSLGYLMKALTYPLIFPLSVFLHYLDRLDHHQTITSHFECVFVRE